MTRTADDPAAPPVGERHLLLVVRHFGPAGHTGGFRWWRLVRGLVEQHGWSADVVTTAEPTAAWLLPRVRVARVSDEWIGSRARIAASRAVASIRGEAPEQPDAVLTDGAPLPGPDEQWPGDVATSSGGVVGDVLRATKLATELVWARRAARAARSAPARPDVVIASQPSETAPLAGIAASRHHGAPLVVDHRHVWGLGQPPASVRSRTDALVGDRVAPRVDDATTLAVDIAATATEQLRGLDGSPPRAFVPSGWDPDDAPADVEVDTERFRIVHTGWLYPFHDPRPLVDGVARLLARRPALTDRLTLEMVGTRRTLAGVDLVELGAAAGVPRTAWSFVDRVPKPEAMHRAGRAAALVAWSFPDGLQAPSKLYDYALCSGELVLIGAPDDALARDAAQIEVATVQDAAGVADRLTLAADKWRDGGPWARNDPDAVLAAAASLDRLAPLLAAVADGTSDDALRRLAERVAPPWPSTPAATASSLPGGAP